MSSFLELVATDSGRLLPGMRWQVERQGRTRLGRRQTNDVVLPSPLIAPHHCELWPRDGALWVRDTGSPQGLFLYNDDVPVRFDEHRLQDGDCFGSGEVVLCYGEELPPWPAGSETYIAAIDAQPDDDARFRVWGDYLLEAGHPMGKRIARGTPSGVVEPRQWLAPLGYAQRHGLMKVRWRYGFVTAVALHPGAQGLSRWLLPRLASLPVGRFLQTVSLDLNDDLRDADGDGAMLLSNLLLELCQPPLLEVIDTGPMTIRERYPAQWERLIARYPRLR